MIAEGAFGPDEVAGLATSGRGSGAVFVDAEGRVLAPHWLDGRNAPQHRKLVERFGPECDNRALASKTLHLKEEHPELFARMRHPLYVKDFLLYRMTGAVATDPSSGPRVPDGDLAARRLGVDRRAARAGPGRPPAHRDRRRAAARRGRPARPAARARRSGSAATTAPAPTPAPARSRPGRSA